MDPSMKENKYTIQSLFMDKTLSVESKGIVFAILMSLPPSLFLWWVLLTLGNMLVMAIE